MQRSRCGPRLQVQAESRDPPAVAATYARLLERNPPGDVKAKALNRLGLAHELAGDLAKGLSCYQQAIAADPAGHLSLRNCANALANLERAAEAEPIIDQAVKLRPDVADLRYIRGNILAAQRRYPEATAAHTEAIARDPKHADAWYNRGVIRRRTKDYEGAAADQVEVLKLRGNYRNAVYEMAVNRIFQKQDQWPQTVQELSGVVQDMVLGWFALALRGLAWSELGGSGLQAAAAQLEPSVLKAAQEIPELAELPRPPAAVP